MLPIPGLDPGPVDSSEAAFASGMLAGAGLREIHQVLGLSRKRGGAATAGGAMPTAATMAGGAMGDLDKIMLLARLQSMAGGGGGILSEPTMALDMAGSRPPLLPLTGPSAPPMGPVGPPLLPPPFGPPPLGPPPMSPQPPLANPGGALPLQLLMKMLSGTGGMV